MKYHISPETGRPNQCHAEKRACPIGGADEHYENKDEARSAYESSMAERLLTSVSKTTTSAHPLDSLATTVLKSGAEIRFKDYMGNERSVADMDVRENAEENCGNASWAAADFLVQQGFVPSDEIGVNSYECSYGNHDVIRIESPTGATIVDFTCRQFEPEGPLYRVQDQTSYETWLEEKAGIGQITFTRHFPYTEDEDSTL